MRPIPHLLTRMLMLMALAGAIAGCALPPGSPITLRPVLLRTFDGGYGYTSNWACTEVSGSPIQRRPSNATVVLVGRDVFTRSVPGFEQCQTTAFDYEAGMRYDLQSFGQVSVKRAYLTFRLLGTEISGAGRIGFSCASDLDLGTNNWTSPDTNPSEKPLVTLPFGPIGSASPTREVSVDAHSGTLAVDVTQVIQDWLTGQTPNDGFLMSMGTDRSSSCVSEYGDFALTVTTR